jgi:hypothetical protein
MDNNRFFRTLDHEEPILKFAAFIENNLNILIHYVSVSVTEVLGGGGRERPVKQRATYQQWETVFMCTERESELA